MRNNIQNLFVIITLMILQIACKKDNQNNNSIIDQVTSSVNGELTREEAKNKIISLMNYPITMIDYENIDNLYVNNSEPIFGYNFCSDNGLFEPYNPSGYYGKFYKLTEEAKKFIAKPVFENNLKGKSMDSYYKDDYRYLVSQPAQNNYFSPKKLIGLKIGTIDFGEVTGIKDVDVNPFDNSSSNTSTIKNVEFTLLISDITLIGEVKRRCGANIESNLENGKRISAYAKFQKYDDGWRCEQVFIR